MRYDVVMARRLAILTEGLSDTFTAKTAVSVIRYCGDEVVAVIDSTRAGQNAQAVFGVGGAIPFVASVDEARGADTLLIGIAPPGGKLPPAMRRVVLEAIERRRTGASGV